MKRAGRIVIDIIMSLLLLFLMAYQVTGGKYHEWLGAAMLVLFIVHNVLNFKWYKQLFKGRYSAARVLRVVVNFITLISIILTGYSGIKMSQYVFNFIPVNSGLMMARKLHLAFSYWSFVFMSIHLGLHWSMVTAKFNKLGQVFKWILRVVAAGAAVYGAYLFGKSGIYTYMFMKVMFAMLDFKSPAVVVIINNLFMMSTWCFVGYYLNKALLKKKNVLYCLLPVAIVVISIFCTFKFAENISFGNDSDWSAGSFDNGNSGEYVMSNTSNLALPDNFIYINGGTFNMGSPETENWRSSDETLHEVKVNSFYMSAYELTQKEYMEICGNNPSTFSGDNLPVENISWLDAVTYCNKRSEAEGLTPAYVMDGNNVSWNRSADGYRLPTEAEWEYACRAGTTTPFNTENSISAAEANYYGHYPYDIEENYFNQDNLTTKPGQYRETTVAVDSFSSNKWGLYNMHGNVAEWVWDYYGAYDSNLSDNPTGAANGSLRVYRGGGWNDFAKNMRSAYRATLEQDKGSFNIGLRLVRNAETSVNGIVGSANVSGNASGNSGKTIIPFCSHGGGRFGQSLTAIARLAPNSKMGTPLSIHYGGGSSLSSDITQWLKENGLK